MSLIKIPATQKLIWLHPSWASGLLCPSLATGIFFCTQKLLFLVWLRVSSPSLLFILLYLSDGFSFFKGSYLPRHWPGIDTCMQMPSSGCFSCSPHGMTELQERSPIWKGTKRYNLYKVWVPLKKFSPCSPTLPVLEELCLKPSASFLMAAEICVSKAPTTWAHPIPHTHGPTGNTPRPWD